MVSNIDEDEKEKKATPIYNVYNGQYENQECLFLTVDEDEKLKVRPKQSLGLLTNNNEYWFLTEDGAIR